jgi:C-terminal processing protease CtpA/Prc
MRIVLASMAVIFITGCGVSKNSFSPSKKYSPGELQRDYAIYESILKDSHPGLYWYTDKETMEQYLREGERQLKDSMTETQFRRLLTYTTAQINCGHTTVRSSKQFSSFVDSSRLKLFPLSMKVWGNYDARAVDTMLVTTNLLRDTIYRRGTRITKINGRTVNELVDTMFKYISSDGYNRTHKFQTLSNRGFFGSLYTSLFGLSEKYTIDYIDSAGATRTGIIPVFTPSVDTSRSAGFRQGTLPPPVPDRERRDRQKDAVRQLRIDSVTKTAFMELNTFGRGYQLKGFFRRSFRFLKRNQIDHLIIDVRSNGGGSVTNSTFLSKFIAANKFKVADSLYAIRKKSKYGRYIQNNLFNRIFMTFLTKRRSDGFYHFGYFERHRFKPKKKNHYEGKVYVLTGGNSFSATTLFAQAIMKQHNVVVIGEETGGAAYGNTAWLIPDVTLPETKVRFRLPLFRLVIDKDTPKDGRGIQPEVESKPTIENVRRGVDFKLEKALELIAQDKQAANKK